jgi:hypothetical protein
MRLCGFMSSRGGRVSREFASPLSALLLRLLEKSAYYFAGYIDKLQLLGPVNTLKKALYLHNLSGCRRSDMQCRQ